MPDRLSTDSSHSGSGSPYKTEPLEIPSAGPFPDSPWAMLLIAVCFVAGVAAVILL